MGKLVLIGLPKSAIHIENPLQNVIFKSITLTTVHGRRIFHTWEQCEKHLELLQWSTLASHCSEREPSSSSLDCQNLQSTLRILCRMLSSSPSPLPPSTEGEFFTHGSNARS